MRLIRLLKFELAKEIRNWVEKDIITYTQAEKICSEYNIDYKKSQDQSFAYHILIALAFLFVGLSVITLLGANWQDIPRELRTFGLIGVTIAFHSLGIYKFHRDQKKFAVNFFLLGNMLFGATIILVGQMFHLGRYMHEGLFWWCVGSIPFAYITRSSWLTLFSLCIANIWAAESINALNYPYFYILILACITYIFLLCKQNSLLFMGLIISLVLWINLSITYIWRDFNGFGITEENIILNYAICIFIFAISKSFISSQSSTLKDYGTLLNTWALRLCIISLFPFSYKSPWRDFIHHDWPHKNSLIFFSAVLIIGALFVSFRSSSFKNHCALAASFLIYLLSLLNCDTYSFAIYFQIFTNTFLLSCGIFLIYRGVRDAISHYFISGICVIMLLAFMRYFDLIGNYIGGALLFFFFAVIIFLCASYWKKRLNGNLSS